MPDRRLERTRAAYRDDVLIDPCSVTHAIPENDLYDHRAGTDCPCQPMLQVDKGHGTIVHRAWDGRLTFEQFNESELES